MEINNPTSTRSATKEDQEDIKCAINKDINIIKIRKKMKTSNNIIHRFVILSTVVVLCSAMQIIAGTGTIITPAGTLDTRNPTNVPTNIVPANAELVNTLTPELESSAFVPSYSGKTHFASQWQLSRDAGFSGIVADSGETTSALTNYIVSEGALATTNRYFWHVRYKNDTGGWSPYSPATYFDTMPLACSFTADKTIGIDSLFCTFNATVQGTNTVNLYYRWDFNNDGIIDVEGVGESSPFKLYNSYGSYSVRLTVSNAIGEVVESLRRNYINVLEDVKSEFSAMPVSGPAALEVQFTDLSENHPQYWSWDFDNNGVIDSTNQNPEFTYMSTGQFTVALTVSNNFGAEGASFDTLIKTNYITVTSPPDLVADFYASPLTGLVSLSVQFYDASSNGAQYWFWDFDNDGVTDSTSQYPGHTYNAAGNYAVKLTVSNDIGQVNSKTRTAYIHVWNPLAADFIADKSQAKTGENIQFTDMSENHPSFFMWDFDNDGFVDSNVQNPVTNFGTPGWKTVTLSISNFYSSALVTKTNIIKITGMTPYHYVSLTGSNTPPFITWAAAATNAQDAINAAEVYDTVFITNGVYSSAGYFQDGTNVIILNKQIDVVGMGNVVIDGKGIMRCAHIISGMFSNIRFENGVASGSANAGRGGGVFCAGTGMLSRCILENNNANEGGGAIIKENAQLRSCLVASNNATVGGGLSFQSGGAVYNVTVADNEAAGSGGGIYCNNSGTLLNTIVYSNTAPVNANYYNAGSGMSYAYCCTTPDPGGTGNITDDPELELDYRISTSSPCRDAGTNLAWMSSAEDLSGGPRVFGNFPDMGAFEVVSGAFIRVSADVLNFGGVIIGSSTQLTLNVENVGTEVLNGFVSGTNDQFSIVSGSPYSIGVMSNENVVFSFMPNVVGSLEQTVTLSGGGGAEVELIGQGIPEPCLFIIYNLLIMIYYCRRKFK